MNKLKKKFKVYWTFSKSVIQIMTTYRVNFCIYQIGILISALVTFYIWKAVFASSQGSSIYGFSMNDMVSYIFISSILAIAINCDTDQEVGFQVKDGSIAMQFIKPINYQVTLFFNALGGFIFQFLFIALPIGGGLLLVRYFAFGQMPPNIFTIFFFLISVILSFVILFFINYLFGIMSFYVTNVWGISHLKYVSIKFLSGEVIPLAFFPLWAQKVIGIFPFKSLNYTPVMIFLGKYTSIQIAHAIFIQIFWIIALFALNKIVWNRANERLTILGG